MALGLILILAPLAIFTLYHPAQPEAGWWDSSWQYRKKIPITTHTAEEENVYINISNYDASDTTRYQVDCGDMRFTKQNGELLPYYVTNCGATSTIHVNFDVFPAGAQNIYLYYGNPSADNGFSPADFSTEASNYSLGTLASEETTPGPVAYWKFDEGQGQITYDQTSNNNDGTLGRTSNVESSYDPQWQTEDKCISGKCLYFDGTDDKVAITSNANAKPNYITLSVWIRTSNSTSDQKFLSHDQAGPYQSLLVKSDGRVRVEMDGVNKSMLTMYGSKIVNDGRWHHVAATYDGSNVRLYIDGLQDTSSAYNGGVLQYGSASWALGVWQNTLEDYLGFIDEVKIYPYARTADQVKADFNQYATVLGVKTQEYLSEGLVGYWKMDEISGTSVADASGNGNNGTLTNAQEAGTSDASGNSTTTLIDSDSDSLSTTDDAYNGMILRFTGACGSIISGTERVISDYTGATKTITVSTALAQAPDNCAYEIRHQVGGKFGSGIAFGSDNDYISTLYPGNLDSFTASVWVYYPTQAAYEDDEGLLSYNCSANGCNFRLRRSNNSATSWRYEIWNESGTASGTTNCVISGSLLDQWNLFTITYDQKTMKGYVNGQEKCTYDANLGPLQKTNTNLFIGRRNNADEDYFYGKMDEARIYNRALSVDEVKALYNWAPGPVGYWPMDEGVSGDAKTIHDLSGYGNNGSTIDGGNNTGMNCSVVGKIGKACEFDGVDDYINAGTSTVLQPNTYTFEAWVKIRKVAFNVLASFVTGDYGTIHPGWNSSNPGVIAGKLYGINYASTPINVNDGQWHHLAYAVVGTSQNEVDFANTKFYVDGILHGVNSSTTTGTASPKVHFWIGGNAGSRTLNGIIDEVKIYNYARTQAQVIEDMNAGHPIESVENPVPKTTMSFGGSDEADELADGAGAPPIAEWKFDEKQDTLAYDSSGNANDGTVNGATWKSGCKQGACLEFDGVDDYTEYGDILDMGTKDMTISLWLKTTVSGSQQYALSKARASNTNFRYGIATNMGQAKIFIRGSGGSDVIIQGVANVADDQWHYIVATIDRDGAASIYVDGKFDASASISIWNGQDFQSSNPFRIGSYTASDNVGLFQPFSGQIDHVRIYDYARTPAQIAYDYNRGAPVAHWKFDACEGTTIHDSSKNGNNGTLIVTTVGGNSAGVGTCNTANSAWGSGAAGKYGASLNFDGDGDYVDIGNITRSDIYTVSFWAKPNGSSESFLQLSSSDTVAMSGGTMSIGGFGTETVYIDGKATTSFPDNNWHHVVVVSGSAITANDMSIGRISTNYYSGQIDDVRIFNYALSSTQVKKLFNGGVVVRFGE